jgi:dephospho-CoA kinase
MPRMKWVGLTGGIATGKSTIARLFESRDYPVIDADQISHDLTRFGEPGYLQIVSHFGPQILLENQQINRGLLGEIIFNDVKKKNELEALLHPLIQKRVNQLRQENELNGQRYCIYDVPLLFEKNMQSSYDFVITAWCSPEQQVSRLMSRNKIKSDQAAARIRTQLALIDKIGGSQYCIDNSGSESDLILIVNKMCDLLDLNHL